MFDWLFEGRSVIYWLLAVLAVLFLLVWWRTRRRNFLLAAGAALALAGVYYLLSQMVETPRAQIVRKLHEMAGAVKSRDTEGILKHIARDFNYHGRDRDAFRGNVDTVLKGKRLDDLVIDDEEWPEGGDERTCLVAFRAKPKGPGLDDYPAFQVEATFVREADGQWRMRGFKVFPFGSRQELVIPTP